MALFPQLPVSPEAAHPGSHSPADGGRLAYVPGNDTAILHQSLWATIERREEECDAW